MSSIPHLVGMVHLGALPGAPAFEGSMDKVIDSAIHDASLLKEVGFPALMVENFGDAPFYSDSVPAETVAGLTMAVNALMQATDLPVGVNVLRNDALAAIAIAGVTGAPLVRVNVLTGIMYTDQGPIVGRAAELLRKRAGLESEAEVWADVLVKHATPPPGLDVRQAAQDTIERGLADAIIVSGSGTGSAPDLDRLKTVREAVGTDVRIVIGSGATPDNLADLCATANTVIAGSYTKVDGRPSNRVDRERATAMVNAAREVGLI